jgi:hypothetical protein
MRRDPEWTGPVLTEEPGGPAVPDHWGHWRGLETGSKPEWQWPENADAAFDQVPIPPTPIETDLDDFDGGPAGPLPWWDAKEDPYAPTGLYASMEPTYPVEDVGGLPPPGAYESAVRSRGPVYPAYTSYEPSGGLGGDQALGRIMRFPANVPQRDDPWDEGVWLGDYHDDLAIAVANNAQGDIPDNDVTASLVGWTGGSY